VGKILVLVILTLMLVHIIKPLGWPGLRKRTDAWKIALGAIALIAVAATFNHSG
jgi:hypothetical protein